MADAKTISRDTYLKALALVTMGNDHARKSYEIEAALQKLIEGGDVFGDFGHLTDLMHSSDAATVASFDEALKRASYVVTDA